MLNVLPTANGGTIELLYMQVGDGYCYVLFFDWLKLYIQLNMSF